MLNLKFWQPREKFLVIGIAPQRTTGLLLSVDKDRNLKPERFWDNFSFAALGRNPLKALRKKKLIVAADPAFIATIFLPLELEREEFRRNNPVSLEELEGLISQAIDREFHRNRSEAGKRLGLDELDAVLVGARVAEFKVDGHRVLNLEGFVGKNLGALLELTFTARKIFDDFKDFFNSREGLHFTGTAVAGLRMLSLVGAHPVNLLMVDHGGSRVFTLDKVAWGESISREPLNWSFVSLFEAIAAEIPVSRDIVVNFYYDHLNRNTSGNFAHALGRVMKPARDQFFTELKQTGLSGPVYVHSPVPLPMSLPHEKGRMRLEELPTGKIVEKFGLATRLSEWPVPASEIFTHLTPFLEFYHDKSNSEVNRRLRRRLHWLIQ